MKKRIILVSHCIMNQYSKVESTCPKNPDIIRLLSFLMEKRIGIIQLPCPETHMYGLKRWGHVKDQFDTPFFRSTSKDLLKPIVGQVKDYINNGYELLGIVAIEGSPSCGASKTCTGKEWGGDFKDIKVIEEKISKLVYGDGKGVFMEELEKMLNIEEIEHRFLGLYGEEVDNLIKSIENVL